MLKGTLDLTVEQGGHGTVFGGNYVTDISLFLYRLRPSSSLFLSLSLDSKSIYLYHVRSQQSALFDNEKWQIFFYSNSGHDQCCSLYLSCEPTVEERMTSTTAATSTSTSPSVSSFTAAGGGGGNSAVGGQLGMGGSGGSRGIELRNGGLGKVKNSNNSTTWKREGKFKFSFEVGSPSRLFSSLRVCLTDAVT